MYQISANLVNRELRNATFEGEKTLNLEPQKGGLLIYANILVLLNLPHKRDGLITEHYVNTRPQFGPPENWPYNREGLISMGFKWPFYSPVKGQYVILCFQLSIAWHSLLFVKVLHWELWVESGSLSRGTRSRAEWTWMRIDERPGIGRKEGRKPDILILKHSSSILRQSSNPVCAKWLSLFHGSRCFTHTSKSCLSPAIGRRSDKLVSLSSTPLLTCTMQTKTSRQNNLQGASKMLYE